MISGWQMEMVRQTKDAANFLASFLSPSVDRSHRRDFVSRVQNILMDKFQFHWYVQDPLRGQGYRCQRLDPRPEKERLIGESLHFAGLINDDIKLPLQLTLWIDPHEVAYRIGDEDGSICTLATYGQNRSRPRRSTVSPRG